MRTTALKKLPVRLGRLTKMRKWPPAQTTRRAGGTCYLGGLFSSTRLSPGLGPIEGLAGLGLNVLRESALQALFVFSIHIPVQVQVALTPGTCSVQHHRYCSILIRLVVLLISPFLKIYVLGPPRRAILTSVL